MISTWQGVVIGLTVAAPIGPMGILCIRRSVTFGRSLGLATGLGTASAHAIYGLVAFAGVRGLCAAVIDHGSALRHVSGLLIVALGVRIACTPSRRDRRALRKQSWSAAYVSAVALCLANPLTLVSFAGLLGGTDLTGGASVDVRPLVLGIFAGSSLWWLLVSSMAGTLAGRIDNGRMSWLNRATGTFLVALGVATLPR